MSSALKSVGHWYQQTYHVNPVDFILGGVGLENIAGLMSHYFNYDITGSPIDAIDEGHPVMTSIATDVPGVLHNVLITGYNPAVPGQYYYLDPYTGKTEVGDSYKFKNYIFEITSCK